MTLVGRRLAGGSDGAVRRTLAAILEALRWRPATDRVVVLPDAHYPYHPSTGLVTNPVVVEAVLRELLAADVEAAIGVPGSPWLDAGRTARYLGYERLAERLGTDVIALTASPGREASIPVDGRDVTLEIPAPLVEHEVVLVPTLRADRELRLAAALVTLAAGVADEPPTAERAAAAGRLVDPSLVLLDGTYTYTGVPHAARFLLAGEPADAVDRAAAVLLGLEPDAVPALSLLDAFEVRQPEVAGLSLAELAAELPRRGLPTTSEPGRLMKAGYRGYARLTGDAVPPQFLGDG